VKDRGVDFCIIIASLVINKATEVGSKLSSESSDRIDL
jgi:hypothetical protein